MADTLPPKILVLENHNIDNSILCNTVERKCFSVLRFNDYQSVLRDFRILFPNIIVISSRIEGISALEFAVRLRKLQGLSSIPIIFIIDEGESIANYESLDTQFVECINRPIDTNRFVYIIRHLLRKSKSVLTNTVLYYKGLSMNLANYMVSYNDHKISLGPIEFKILQLLLCNPGVTYSRQDIIDCIFDNSVHKSVSTRTIDVHVNRIRRSIKKTNDNNFSIIKTIRSVGYCLV